MLTDPAGRMVERSTTSYQPTKPIWRWVVAAWNSCFRPGCDAPATTSEGDHRIPWPAGPTSAENLWPGCRSDHKAKHTQGFSIEQNADGSFTFHTRAGFSHTINEPTHPASTEWPEVDVEVQHSAVELLQALDLTRLWREMRQNDDAALLNLRQRYWEDDLDLDPADEARLAHYAVA